MSVAVLKVSVWHDNPPGTIREQSPDIGHTSLSEALSDNWVICDVVGIRDGDHVRVDVTNKRPPSPAPLPPPSRPFLRSALLDVYRAPHGSAGRVFSVIGATLPHPAGDYLANWLGDGWTIHDRGIEWADPPYGDRELIWLIKPS